MTSPAAKPDVVVVGYGGAGVCAALEAVDRGATVVALDRFRGGGATRASGGVVYAGGQTRAQRRAGFEDTTARMLEYLRKETRGESDDGHLRVFCERSAEDLRWLETQGVCFPEIFHPEKSVVPPAGVGLFYSGNEKAMGPTHPPRGHVPEGRGQRGHVLFDRLADAARDKGVEVRARCRATRLLRDDLDRVVGVEALQLPAHGNVAIAHDVLARAAGLSRSAGRVLDAFERKHGRLVRLEASGGVVLATGGFVLNGAMMERHAPRLAKALPLGTAGDDGSGISMAAEIGAAVDRMDRCAAWRFFYPPKAFLSGVLVNLLGQRFCDESSYGATVGRLISEQPSGRAFLVIDAEVVRRVASEAGRDERLVDRSLKDLLSGRANDLIFRKLTTWLNVNVNRYRRPALEEIERACSMPAGSLVSTITEHNRRLEANEPDAFGKGDEMRRPIAEPPFLAIPCELENKLFLGPCFTLGGLKTDPSSGRALRPDGTVIPGLFAAGRCAVGVSTGGYVSGLSIADCVFSGRNAGRSAASRAGSGEGEAPAGAGSVTTTASGGESSLDSDGPSILITGGGGFLGRALTARLFDQDRLQGDEGRPLRPKRVRVLDRRLAPTEWPGPVEVTPGDICDPDTVRRAVRDMDLVVHAAALVDWGQLPPERVFEVNLEATHRLIEACRESTVRGLVHISSLDAVWRGESMRDVDESWPYPDRFDTPYCESKALSEEAVLEASSDGLRTVVIRPCSIWGESDPYHLQPLVDASRLGVLPRVGNGVMQWVYVGNVAHAITLAGRATLDASPEACGQVYFATDFPARTFCDQMEPMLTAAGIRVTRWSMPRLPLAAAATVMWRACRLLRPVFDIQPVLTPFAVAQLYGDFTVSTDKAERLLGYRPLYSEEAAYERTIRALGLDLEANRR